MYVENNVYEEWSWSSDQSIEVWTWRWVSEAGRGVASSKNPKYGIPWYDKLICCHNFYYYIYSLEYIAGRQAKGFVAVAVESDEWQAQRGPRSEFKTGLLVFQSICLCLSSNGCHIC